MQKVQCEILGLSSSPSTGGAYAILLKEIEGVRRLPIIIGAFEAQAIALEIEGIKPPRPLTHDLLKQIIDNLGGSVNEVIINELRENTFYAKIVLDVSGLTNGSSYNYYVACQNADGYANTTDYPISFSIASASSGGGSTGGVTGS